MNGRSRPRRGRSPRTLRCSPGATRTRSRPTGSGLSTETFPTLAQVLSSHGYATAGFVGNLSYTGAENGLARGFSHYEDFLVKPSTFTSCPSLGHVIIERVYSTAPVFLFMRNGADEVGDGFVSWLGEQQQEERPFFAFLNFFDAHAMYVAPEGYDTRFGPRGERIVDLHRKARWSAWSTEEQQAFVDAYDGCIAFIDDQIGRIVDELRTRELLDDTLIIVVGDHGEQFGEHDLIEHANSL